MDTDETKIVFLHGVGMWPGWFTPVARALGRPLHAWARPGYGPVPTVETFREQVATVRARVIEEGPVVLAGVSGGATIALAVAMHAPPGLTAVVTHEPLVGPLQPTLHQKVRRAADELTASVGRDAVLRFLRGLYGSDFLDEAPDAAREWVEHHRATVLREVPQFVGFAPKAAALAAVNTPHLTTFGERSGAERKAVARMLARVGASTQAIAGAGHLVPAQNPGGFAEAIASFLDESVDESLELRVR